MFLIHIVAVCRVGDFWQLAAANSDDLDYIAIARVIRSWHFSGGPFPGDFWGFPYAIAAFTRVLPIPDLMAAVLISVLASAAVCILAHRLYGGWAAAAFVVVNYGWILVSVEGGSEPLFMCLLYAAFVATRAEKWTLAGLLAALSTTVRPVGVLALASFALVLVSRRDFRRTIGISLLGVAMGVLYVVPVWLIFGSPFANFHLYQAGGDWGPHGFPLTYPFGALISSCIHAVAVQHVHWYTLATFIAWPAFAILGGMMVWAPSNRQSFLAKYPAEAIFTTFYVLFFIVYNNFEVIWLFSRFLIPVLPLLVFSLRDGIPKDRRVIWGAAALSALMSAAAIVRFRNVFGFNLP